jgi:hypothetical protein
MHVFDRSEAYHIDFQKAGLALLNSQQFMHYADALKSLHEQLKSIRYSPFHISPMQAGIFLKRAEKNYDLFFSLSEKFQDIKEESVGKQIIEILNEIAGEFSLSMDCLKSLSDPEKHLKIKESLGALQASGFLED